MCKLMSLHDQNEHRRFVAVVTSYLEFRVKSITRHFNQILWELPFVEILGLKNTSIITHLC